MPVMRAPLRWTLTLLLALIGALSVAGAAAAADATLKVTPSSGPTATPVELLYDASTLFQQCPSASTQGVTVRFSFDNKVIGTGDLDPQTCQSEITYVVTSRKCGGHTFVAEGVWPNNQGTFGKTQPKPFTLTCVQPSVTIRPSISIAPSPSRSATPSPTPSPTASPTPSATPSASPSATPTPSATLAPESTAEPVTAVSPPDFPTPGGGSGAPWVIGGAALGLLGVGGSLVLLRPKVGTPIAAGVAGVSVLAAAGLIVLAPSDAPKPVISGSYVTGPGAGCAKGDIPLNGGFYDLDVPTSLLRFHPSGSSSDVGYWTESVSGTGQGSTVCLRLGRSVVWKVRDKALDQAKPSGSVSCQVDESLLGGGFAFPWGISQLSSYPKPPTGWQASNAPYTAGPAPTATVSALCAELPDGVKTYVTSSSTAAAGIATASCYPGDKVINGGFSGARVQGSYPVDAGWAAQLGTGGGSAFAVCVKPSKGLGIRSTTVASGDGVATCPGTDTVLAGGWSSGSDYNGLQHFHPEADGWRSESPSGGATAYVLCLRRYA
jgi:hypothetical protein